jgi:hypothetical protein
MIYNPAVTSIAAISDVRYEVVCLKPQNYFEVYGTIEQYYGRNINTSLNGLSFAQRTSYFTLYPEDFVLRVSFNVVPNNGAPASKIVKTFRANVVRVNF